MATQQTERYNATYSVTFGSDFVKVRHAIEGERTWFDAEADRLRSLCAHVAEPAAVVDDYFNDRAAEWANARTA